MEHDTAQSMQMLLQLDTIKSRMKAASDALQVNQGLGKQMCFSWLNLFIHFF